MITKTIMNAIINTIINRSNQLSSASTMIKASAADRYIKKTKSAVIFNTLLASFSMLSFIFSNLILILSLWFVGLSSAMAAKGTDSVSMVSCGVVREADIGSTPAAIGRVSPTCSTEAYIKPISPDIYNTLRNALEEANKERLMQPPQTFSFKTLPIVTNNMTSGIVEPKKVDLKHLEKPIFIVGNDEQSYEWLRKYSNRLKEIHAVGLLVKADSKSDLERIHRAANGALILPMSGDDISAKLKIFHYPVLITKNLIEQ